MAFTTPDLHSNPWGLVVLPEPLCLTLHSCARHFLNASIASDTFDSTYQTHETTDGLQSTQNCQVYPNHCIRPNTTRSPRVHHVFSACFSRVSTCSPRVYHVFTTCSPRVYHVFTTCSPRVQHVFTTCSPRVQHVFTPCSPRVHDVFTTCSRRVHHVFTTCSPRVHHVFTMCTPRVHHVLPRVLYVSSGLVNQVTEKDEGVVDRDHFYV